MKKIYTTNGVYFVDSKKALDDSLFAGGASASGYFERVNKGNGENYIIFYKPTGIPICAVLLDENGNLICCTVSMIGNRKRFAFGLSSIDAKRASIPMEYTERETCVKSIWEQASN